MLELDVEIARGGFRLAAALRLPNTVTGLFGRSGSGKSSLLGAIAGLVRPRRGRIALDGRTLCDIDRGVWVPPHRRRIGLVFQDAQLFPHLTVRANLEYGLKLAPPRERRFSLAQIAALLDIERLLGRRPHHLSGGETQRVALGRALLSSPRLLLLDEPLAALDEGLKQQILPFLRRVKDELGTPMLYVSHAINEILHLTSALAVLDGGRVLACGSFGEVIHDDAVLRLAQSLGLENVIAARVTGHDADGAATLADFNGREMHLPPCAAAPGSIAYLSLRASNVALALAPVAGTTIQNQLPGTIRRITRVADRMLVELDVGQPLIAEVSVHAVQTLGLAPDMAAICLVKAQALSFLGGANGKSSPGPARRGMGGVFP